MPDDRVLRYGGDYEESDEVYDEDFDEDFDEDAPLDVLLASFGEFR